MRSGNLQATNLNSKAEVISLFHIFTSLDRLQASAVIKRTDPTGSMARMCAFAAVDLSSTFGSGHTKDYLKNGNISSLVQRLA